MKKRYMIPDKIFHKIWEITQKYENKEDFTKEFRKRKEYRKMMEECRASLVYEILETVYIMSHKSIRDIMKENGIRNSVLSHKMCIPEKTIEGWKVHECPGYVRLGIMERFGIKYLPDGVVREYVDKSVDRSQKNVDKLPLIKDVREIKVPVLKEIQKKGQDENISDEEFEKMLDRKWSLREYEQTHVGGTRNHVLNSTDYLDEIMKRK